MPLKSTKRGASKKARNKVVSKNISEFAHGPTFAKIARKKGRKAVLKVAVAAGINAAKPKRKKSKKR